MDSQSRQSAYYGNAVEKPSHKYSTADSQRALAQQRFAMYQSQPASQDGGFLYRVSNQGTDMAASEAQHQARVQAEMARIMSQSSGRRS